MRLLAWRADPAFCVCADLPVCLQDLQQAGRQFGSSSVQLQLVFKRPLHPFYPPSVQLVSPRFQGPILRWVHVQAYRRSSVGCMYRRPAKKNHQVGAC